jgi:hypothetical protein
MPMGKGTYGNKVGRPSKMSYGMGGKVKKNKKGKFMYGMGGKVIKSTRMKKGSCK